MIDKCIYVWKCTYTEVVAHYSKIITTSHRPGGFGDAIMRNRFGSVLSIALSVLLLTLSFDYSKS